MSFVSRRVKPTVYQPWRYLILIKRKILVNEFSLKGFYHRHSLMTLTATWIGWFVKCVCVFYFFYPYCNCSWTLLPRQHNKTNKNYVRDAQFDNTRMVDACFTLQGAFFVSSPELSWRFHTDANAANKFHPIYVLFFGSTFLILDFPFFSFYSFFFPLLHSPPLERSERECKLVFPPVILLIFLLPFFFSSDFSRESYTPPQSPPCFRQIDIIFNHKCLKITVF